MEDEFTDKQLNSTRRRGNPNWVKGKVPIGAKPWCPGQSGNPEGRKHKEDCLASCVKEELSKLSPNGVMTNEQLIASVLVAIATRGNLKAIEIARDTAEGRPNQAISLRGDITERVTLNFVKSNG